MSMVPVVSDNVAFVGYDHATHTLRVRFLSGGTYDYTTPPRFCTRPCCSRTLASGRSPDPRSPVHARRSLRWYLARHWCVNLEGRTLAIIRCAHRSLGEGGRHQA